MLNPFLQTEAGKNRRLIMGGSEETAAQQYGHTLEGMSQPSVGLWIGRLLIRIGEKLAKKDSALKNARENA